MRRALQVGGGCFVWAAIASSCSSGPGTTNDASVDTFVSYPCATSAYCPSGTACLYPTADGCSATRRCIPNPNPTTCSKPQAACGCDGSNQTVCDGASVPIAYLGLCQPDAGGGGCGDPSGYLPPTLGKPTVTHACTMTDLQAFVTACFSAAASTTTCDAWKAQDAGVCGACLAPRPQTSPDWGPFDCASSSGCRANSGGCVDLVLGDVAEEHTQGGAGSCGDAITATLGCEDYVCQRCPNVYLLTSCISSAVRLTGPCKAYFAVQDSATGPCAVMNGDAAPGVTRCFPQTDADNLAFVDVFCGAGP